MKIRIFALFLFHQYNTIQYAHKRNMVISGSTTQPYVLDLQSVGKLIKMKIAFENKLYF